MHQTAARRTPAKLKVKYHTLGDVLEALGNIAPDRVRFDVKPGRATVRDLIKRDVMGEMPCELVDGFLVEKAMGNKESSLAMELGRHLGNFAEAKILGYVCGADGYSRLAPGLVRAPDVSFVSWTKRPDHTYPDEPVPDLVPDLAVEVISEGNTKGEMDRKGGEYFTAGVRLVWFIDPKKRTVKVCTSLTAATTLSAADSLDGGDVLPGFSLPLSRLFKYVPPPRKGRKKK